MQAILGWWKPSATFDAGQIVDGDAVNAGEEAVGEDAEGYGQEGLLGEIYGEEVIGMEEEEEGRRISDTGTVGASEDAGGDTDRGVVGRAESDDKELVEDYGDDEATPPRDVDPQEENDSVMEEGTFQMLNDPELPMWRKVLEMLRCHLICCAPGILTLPVLFSAHCLARILFGIHKLIVLEVIFKRHCWHWMFLSPGAATIRTGFICSMMLYVVKPIFSLLRICVLSDGS